MNPLDRVHGGWVHRRRVARLADALLPLLPDKGIVLDVGCGDGALAHELASRNKRLDVRGLDVMVRGTTLIPVIPFDGRRIPFNDDSVAAVLMVDVLHHADDPKRLLADAVRAARSIVIKDHLRQGLGAAPTLRFMDWVGNARHGVSSPGRYWSPGEWEKVFAELHLQPSVRETRLKLYPWPASWIFGRGLHFAVRLERASPEDVA